MRYFDTDETYEYFFKDSYGSKYNMTSSFSHLKKIDKKGEYLNKKYLISSNGYYKEKDIREFLKWKQEQYNTIQFAKQLIVDFEAIFEHYGLKLKVKLAKLIGINSQCFTNLDFGYDISVKIINAIKNRLMQISPEARREIKYMFNEVKNDN